MALRIFFSGVALFCALLAVYVYSLYAGLFFSLAWWDIPMHVAGGALAGLIGMWFFAVSGRPISYTSALYGAIILGIGVEVVEYIFGFTYSPFMSYPVDTIKDLFNDLIGAVLIAYVFSKI